MSEHVIIWDGIGADLTESNGNGIAFLRRVRRERLRESIVRCRNCVRYVPGVKLCTWFNEVVEGDGFCAWGRKQWEG